MSNCQLCGKLEDERNTQTQGGYTLCVGCDGLYSDEELKERLSMKGEIGFLHDDIWIDDPTMSECGRFKVDPKTYYGLDD